VGIDVSAIEIVIVAGRQHEGPRESLHQRKATREDLVRAGNSATAPDVADVKDPLDPGSLPVHVPDEPFETRQILGRVGHVADEREVEAPIENAGPCRGGREQDGQQHEGTRAEVREDSSEVGQGHCLRGDSRASIRSPGVAGQFARVRGVGGIVGGHRPIQLIS